MRLIHRCRDRDDDKVRVGEICSIGRDAQLGRRLELRLAYFACRVQEVAVRGDLFLGKIEADGGVLFPKLDGKGQTYVSQADHGDDDHFDSLRGICSRTRSRAP